MQSLAYGNSLRIDDSLLQIALGLVRVPHFDRQVSVSGNPKLEARVTNKGFEVKSGDAEFSFKEEDKWSMSRLYPTKNERSHTLLDDFNKKEQKYLSNNSSPKQYFPSDYLIHFGWMPANSTLIIHGMPDVVMDTRYTPGKLTVVNAREKGEVWQSGKGEFLYLRELSKSKNPAIEDDRFNGMAQRAATKALGDLSIDDVYRQFQRMQTEAVRANRLTPGERTLATYLAK